MKFLRSLILLACIVIFPRVGLAAQSIARDWDEQILSAIRIDRPHPPVQARNLFSLSVCMYDAWASFDTNGAVGYIYHAKHTTADIAAARREAISYAAYRMLRERYSYSINSNATLPALANHMIALGYSTNNFSTNTSTPAGVGNSIYVAISNWFIFDGARQLQAYADYPTNQGGYIYTNPQLVTDRPGITDGFGHTVADINRWQRLYIGDANDQGGFPIASLQVYLGPHWLGVRPFALSRNDATKPWIDPGPPPYFGGATHASFVSNVVEVIRRSSELTPDDGATMDISPGAFGNNSLGANDGTGHPINPATGFPYTANIVKRGDFARVLAEFWADGPSSETPPGHWNVLANQVADNTNFVKRIGGTGPIVDDLEWDVKVYFTVNAAVHEAACAAWSLKRYYDGWRPLSAIRYLGGLGQSSDPSKPMYNTNGLPLVQGLIENVTWQMASTNSALSNSIGKIAVHAWPGQPTNPITTYRGVKWILAETWVPYQRTNFVTPAFPGYISGHSTFSRSAAEVLAAITGSPFFPDGMGTYTSVSNISLGFEKGPSQTVRLQWGTYFDAADQAGMSRIWGGIHPPVDDFTGRIVGSQCGQGVWALAQKYFNGSITNTPIMLAIRALNSGQCELRYSALRGFYYKLQSTPSLDQPFADEPGGLQQALDTSITVTNNFTGEAGSYRAVRALSP